LKILVGLPCYDRRLYAQTMLSIFGDRSPNHQLTISTIEACPYIRRARDELVEIFLKGDWDVLLFVDSDVSWDPGSIAKLVESGYPVAAGVYPKRIPHEVDFSSVKLLPFPKRNGDWLEVAGVPMGLCAIHRDVFVCMKEVLKRDWIFHETRDYGEDILFCKELRELGGEVWIDTAMRVRHHDGSMAHEGDFIQWMELRK
jgi:hypothetical protein